MVYKELSSGQRQREISGNALPTKVLVENEMNFFQIPFSQ